MEYYQEALRNCDTHSRSMLAAAQLHLANGNVDACQQMVCGLGGVTAAVLWECSGGWVSYGGWCGSVM